MAMKAETSASVEGWQDEEPVRGAYFDCFVLKVAPCSKRCTHDWTECPYAHVGEKAARRDPRLYNYTGIACVAMKQGGKCALGTSCPYAHSAFEYWLHPTRYHTEICKQGVNCNRKICFFAHRPEELRKPLVRPGVIPDAVAMSTLSALACEADAAVASPLLPGRVLKVQPARLPNNSGSTALGLRLSQAPSTDTAQGTLVGRSAAAAAADPELLVSLAVAASQPVGAGNASGLVQDGPSVLGIKPQPQTCHSQGYLPYHDASPTGVLSRLGSGETNSLFEGALGHLPADPFGCQQAGARRSAVNEHGWTTGSAGLIGAASPHTSMSLPASNTDSQQALLATQETPVQAVLGLLARNDISVEQAAHLLQAALTPQELQLLQLQLALQ